MLLHAKRLAHRVLRRIGVPAYCKTGYKGLDDKLAPYLSFKNGTFLEAGANDGLEQSNTYYLERVKGWKGILVEPVPVLHRRCLLNRPKALVVHAALVARDYEGEIVELETAGLMTMVSDRSGNPSYSREHIESGLRKQCLADSNIVTAPAQTLDQIIDSSAFRKIDFMSLDLEGYEVEALKGLDCERNGPVWMLLEVRDRAAIENLIGDYYDEMEVLSRHERHEDILYRKRHFSTCDKR